MNCFRKKTKQPKTKFRELNVNYFTSDVANRLGKTEQQSHRLQQHEEFMKQKQIEKLLKIYPVNMNKTSKYSLSSFLPVALFYHFSKFTNIYFLLVMGVQLIPGISPFSKSSSIFPVVFITFVSLIRELVDDVGRHKSDSKSNNSQCLCLSSTRQIPSAATSGEAFENVK